MGGGGRGQDEWMSVKEELGEKKRRGGEKLLQQPCSSADEGEGERRVKRDDLAEGVGFANVCQNCALGYSPEEQ